MTNDDRPIDMERPLDDASPAAVEKMGHIDGGAHAAARQGTAGGMGASGAMGGAGAGGPAGVTDLEPGDLATTGDAGAVKTEYEMGHEPPIPEHERVAESGVSRDPEDRVQP